MVMTICELVERVNQTIEKDGLNSAAELLQRYYSEEKEEMIKNEASEKQGIMLVYNQESDVKKKLGGGVQSKYMCAKAYVVSKCEDIEAALVNFHNEHGDPDDYVQFFGLQDKDLEEEYYEYYSKAFCALDKKWDAEEREREKAFERSKEHVSKINNRLASGVTYVESYEGIKTVRSPKVNEELKKQILELQMVNNILDYMDSGKKNARGSSLLNNNDELFESKFRSKIRLKSPKSASEPVPKLTSEPVPKLAPKIRLKSVPKLTPKSKPTSEKQELIMPETAKGEINNKVKHKLITPIVKPKPKSKLIRIEPKKITISELKGESNTKITNAGKNKRSLLIPQIRAENQNRTAKK